MIRFEHVVLPSQEQMAFVIEGMRNPMNSWDKSDSLFNLEYGPDCGGNEHLGGTGINGLGYWAPKEANVNDKYYIGPNDISLMQRLSKTGTDHRKFMRMMPVMVRITAPLYWWKEFDTYKVGTVSNSCSTMHKIAERDFCIEDFSYENLNETSKRFIIATIGKLNLSRLIFLKDNQKEDWWQMIQLLPSSYNQTRNVMLNYEVLTNIYNSRKNHKLDEWISFCQWIEGLPYNELIKGGRND